MVNHLFFKKRFQYALFSLSFNVKCGMGETSFSLRYKLQKENMRGIK